MDEAANMFTMVFDENIFEGFDDGTFGTADLEQMLADLFVNINIDELTSSAAVLRNSVTEPNTVTIDGLGEITFDVTFTLNLRMLAKS
jgi:hypothetical protein